MGSEMSLARYLVIYLSVVLSFAASVRSAVTEPIADFYRGKTVRLLVGGSAGGGYDAVSRLLAKHIIRHIPGNPSVVVENMGGAGSLIMMNYIHN
jgi:tripartite-type tricarboxylate transporter receptor subunit TctC